MEDETARGRREGGTERKGRGRASLAVLAPLPVAPLSISRPQRETRWRRAPAVPHVQLSNQRESEDNSYPGRKWALGRIIGYV